MSPVCIIRVTSPRRLIILPRRQKFVMILLGFSLFLLLQWFGKNIRWQKHIPDLHTHDYLENVCISQQPGWWNVLTKGTNNLPRRPATCPLNGKAATVTALSSKEVLKAVDVWDYLQCLQWRYGCHSDNFLVSASVNNRNIIGFVLRWNRWHALSYVWYFKNHSLFF